MPAAYDNYDYPAYWDARDYEHQSEVLALREFFNNIPKFKKIVDIGAGFGRLTPTYMYRAKKSILVDPSAQLLAQARGHLKAKNIDFVHSKVENVSKKFKKGEFDVVMMIRVMHHIKDPDLVFDTFSKILAPQGYLILEYANKLHGKALLKNIMKGNFTFPLDIFPQSKTSSKNAPLPFLNYHPDVIEEKLGKHGFVILDKRSVSNIRSPLIKKHIPTPILLSLEKLIQSSFAKFHFGPSMFILARKKK
jgi:ubiquinone/menaquinone biosynthesis C-methylase UbiE